MSLRQDLEALAAKWRGLANDAMCRSGTWNGSDMADRVDFMADELAALLAKHAGEALDAVVEEYTQHADDSGCMTLAFTGGCPFSVGQFVSVAAMQPQPPQGGE